MAKSKITPRTRARLTLIGLALLFSSGLIVSAILIASGWRPESSSVRGDLVEPARPVTDVALETLSGDPFRFAALKTRWALVYFAPAECGRVCAQQLRTMRQVVAAQGREAGRVQRVAVLTNRDGRQYLRYTLEDYAGTVGLTGDAARIKALAEQFRTAAGTPLDGLDRIYVVDPIGNFVLSYGPEADPSDIRKDLARLLRASQIG